MKIILFNPLSNNGKSKKTLNKLIKKLNKKNDKYEIYDITKNNIEDIEYIIDDEFIVIGGDGTLHKLLVEFINNNIQNKVYLFKGGSGNDFSRDFKDKLIDITTYITHHPKVNNIPYLTSAGFGVDGEVCYNVNNDTKSNYYSVAVKTIKKFKPFDLKVTVDDKIYEFKNVWFSTVMNGRFIGGGMKLSPKSSRLDDDVEVVVAHNMGVFKLLRLFPTIFIGKHIWFKKNVFIAKGKHVVLEASTNQTIQSDGEIYPKNNILEVKF